MRCLLLGLVTLLVLAPSIALARDVPVGDVAALRAAISGAQPGDVILLADGTYEVAGNVSCAAAGTAAEPIVVRAVTPLGARVRFDALEGFVVRGPHWHFEDLDIEGVCANDSDCEHAWHIVGAADHTVVRGNRAQGFNAHIKANGEGDPRAWPDDVLVEDNEFFNPRVRMTANPVTPIDVVGGRRWIVRGNFIHDHHKGMGDGVSYAAFLKGNGRDGVFERNLVICELLHAGGVRLGLSFGGGGTGPDSICEDGTCSPEHQGGVMRNNVIVHCPTDVGVYVNECADCLVAHNTVYDTTGIDVRFAASDVRVIGNLLSGRVRARDGATLDASGNREMVTEAEWSAWFADPAEADFTLVDGTELVDRGTALAEVSDDYCANARDDGMPDLGAVEYDGDGPCDTTMPGSGGPPVGADGGTSLDGGPGTGEDGGAPSGDAGMALDADLLADGGAPSDEVSGGCGCRVAPRTRGASGALAGLIVLALALSRRAASRSRRAAPGRRAWRGSPGTARG